jgi:hypothetical protein
MPTDTVIDEFKEQIYKRALGACECTNVMGRCGHHHQAGRCTNSLGFSWEIHRKELDGPQTATNVIALCEQCYRNTPAYRKSKGW